MPANLGGWTGIILLVIILLLFGANKLPALAKGVAQSMRIFKSEIKTPPADTGTDKQPQNDNDHQTNTASEEHQEPRRKPER